MEDVRHEMADRVILRGLAYKSWRSEAENLGGKKHIEAEHMSKTLSVKKKKEGVWLEITWDCLMSRGTGTLAEAVRDLFNWFGE
jgi:hypothetical protein